MPTVEFTGPSSDVGPNWSVVKRSIFKTRCQNFASRRLDFHVAETARLWHSEFESEVERSATRKPRDIGKCIHTSSPPLQPRSGTEIQVCFGEARRHFARHRLRGRQVLRA